MSNYHAFFEVHLKQKDLAPAILAGLKDTYSLLPTTETPGTLVLGPDVLLEAKDADLLGEPLLLLEKVVNTELQDRLEKKSENRGFPFFSLHITVWEKEKGGWLSDYDHKARSLEKFPQCRLTEITMAVTCHIQTTSYDSDWSGRQGMLHRALEIRQEFVGLRSGSTSPFLYQNSVTAILSDESRLDEAFNCFKQYYV